MGSYKDALKVAMTMLAQDARRVFLGYGIARGRAMQTLEGVPESQIIETTLAEGLMTSAAIGQAITGNLPVVYFERSDFLTNALDAIVNHLAPCSRLSRGEFTPGVILRVTVGNRRKPLFTGPVHTQDFSEALALMAPSILVLQCETAEQIDPAYISHARQRQLEGKSTAIFEYKDLL